MNHGRERLGIVGAVGEIAEAREKTRDQIEAPGRIRIQIEEIARVVLANKDKFLIS